jgi:hypothetical protein
VHGPANGAALAAVGVATILAGVRGRSVADADDIIPDIPKLPWF